MTKMSPYAFYFILYTLFHKLKIISYLTYFIAWPDKKNDAYKLYIKFYILFLHLQLLIL